MNTFKKTLTLLLALALCLSVSVFAVGAADNATVYEAEDARIEGTFLDYTGAAVDPVETNDKASGGKNVGNFGTVGSSITWTVNVAEAGTYGLGLTLASCFNSISPDWTTYTNEDFVLASHYTITVNGTALDLGGVVAKGAGTGNIDWTTFTMGVYDHYVEVSLGNVALNAGDNTVVLTLDYAGNGQTTETANIDCLTVYAGGAQAGGDGTTAFPETVYEAENAELQGTWMIYDWTSGGYVEGSPIQTDAKASGGQSVGYFSTVGNAIVWTVETETACTTELRMVLASCINRLADDWSTYTNEDFVLATHYTLTVNGTTLDLTGAVAEGAGTAAVDWATYTMGCYDHYVEVALGEISLNAGTNTIALTLDSAGEDGSETANIDCIILGGSTSSGGDSGGTTTEVKLVGTYEAEDADLSGATTSYEGYDMVEEKESASGGKSVGYFSVAGNKIVWTVNMDAAGDYTLDFVLASAAMDFTTWSNGDMTLSGEYVQITVNGSVISYDPVNLPGGAAQYDNWRDVCMEVTLNGGANEIVLEILDATYTPNIDCLKVYEGHVKSALESGSSSGGNNNGGNSGGNNGGNDNNNSGDNNENDDNGNTNNTPVGNGTTTVIAEKSTTRMIADIAVGVLFACLVVVALGALIYLIAFKSRSEEEKAAVRKLHDGEKAAKAAWKREYAAIKGDHAKEISRVKYELERKAAKASRIDAINAMTYGEGVKAMRAERLAYFGKPKAKIVVPLLIVAALVGGLLGANYVSADDRLTYIDGAAGGKYTMVVNGYDWGPGVDKLVIKLDGDVKADDLAKAKFNVSVTYQGWFGSTDGKRDVTAMYLSDKDGHATDSKKSRYIALEFAVGPDDSTSTPFYYDFINGVNNWADPYRYTVTLSSGSELIVDGKIYSTAKIATSAGFISYDADVFNKYSGEFAGITLSYAAYEPEKLTKDNVSNALIIWLHGAGEGGTDPYIDILGNNVTLLAQDPIQSYFDGNGAYVLAPQSPTMWMNDGTGEYTENGASMYTEALMELIRSYVAQHPDIDTDRIIIGGCSNGGYMTMNMLMTYPEYFCAAYPCCEAYADSWITDEMLAKLVDLPICFTHAEADPTVDYETYTAATYARLIAMGAKNVHFCSYADVNDGNGYTYNGHWSWIYALNNTNTVTVNGESIPMWQWLATQSK